jgi:hypothetical protein
MGWMTGFEPATTGATVPPGSCGEGAPGEAVCSDADFHDPEDDSSDRFDP